MLLEAGSIMWALIFLGGIMTYCMCVPLQNSNMTKLQNKLGMGEKEVQKFANMVESN
jgi:hypothetical protein